MTKHPIEMVMHANKIRKRLYLSGSTRRPLGTWLTAAVKSIVPRAMPTRSVLQFRDDLRKIERNGPIPGRTSDMKNIIQLSPKLLREEGCFSVFIIFHF